MDKGSSNSIRVLHVDDEPNFIEMAATFLEREDDRLSVETATTVSEGLDRLSTSEFDCVISDYNMPGQNGIEFLKITKENDPDLPFILFTGEGSESVASEAISAGVTDYLQKERDTSQYALLANRIINAVNAVRAEQAQRRHLQAIESAQEGISILNNTGEYSYVNQSYADLYGYEPEEMIGESFTITYPDDTVDIMQAEIIPIIEKTGVWHGETTGLRADGSTFVERHTLSKTEDGNLICSVWDKTEYKAHKHAIEGLHSTVRELMQAKTAETVAEITVLAVRDVIDLPANAIHCYNETTDCLEPVAWTDEVEEIIADPPSFSSGEGLAWNVFETEQRQVYEDVSENPDRYNRTTAIRSEILLPLGDYGVLLIGSTERNAFDEIDIALAQTLAAYTTTALESIQSEQKLREERDFIDQALETLNDVFYVLGTDGELRRWNSRLQEVSGYSNEEIATMDFLDFFPESEHEHITTALTEIGAHGRATLEAEVCTADDERIPYEFTGARLTDTDGEEIGIVGIGRDISKRKKRERQLEQQNERLDEFASIVSHDLRNPLNVAQGQLKLAQEECDSDHAKVVEEALERMETLIEEILAITRRGAEVLEIEDIYLNNLVTECWQYVETHDASLVAETDQVIQADRNQLQQLFENCIRNAVEHGGKDVTVTIGDLDTGFYIEDTGTGIPDSVSESVFEAGYSHTADGTGLGLSIVKNVVESHEWRVTVSKGNHGGARFEITDVTTI